ncbi:conserved hypothetical protein [Burkholderiales bacterium 8X]|nr:conserved hypothetical protein [Burkholderiales bacterium 8X]
MLLFSEWGHGQLRDFFHASKATVARPSPWPDKILALLRAGNPAAAVAQIKVAPSVRDLQALERSLGTKAMAGKWPEVEVALAESLRALSAPRLHRSP